MTTRSTFSIEEREKILKELEQSELSVTEFARQNGLSRVLLSVWLSRYRGKAVPSSISGAEAVSVSEVPFQEIPFNQLLGPSPSGWAAEILLPGGTTVRLDAQGQAQLLQQLLLRLP